MQLTAHNVNDAYSDALWKMKVMGKVRDSRNGQVMRLPEPVLTTYLNPEQRMLFDAKRDANPFFHIFEGIWMLAGHNDVAFPSRFASQIAQYSDDGRTLRGAYGHRWRNHFMRDQLVWVIEHLKKFPNSRRAVMSMYDPDVDQIASYEDQLLDIPCNTAVYFSPGEGHKLDMTVTNRSNDIIWGCYGANAVHMSMLHEFVARATGRPVGVYRQFSNDWHMYEQHWHLLDHPAPAPVEYFIGHVPLVDDGEEWGTVLIEFEQWVYSPAPIYSSSYIGLVLDPMYTAWRFHKQGETRTAIKEAELIQDAAVKAACVGWLARRVK